MFKPNSNTLQEIEDSNKVFNFLKFKLNTLSMSTVKQAFKRIKSTAIGSNNLLIIFGDLFYKSFFLLSHIFLVSVLLIQFFRIFGSTL
jgi:hypothetical protein